MSYSFDAYLLTTTATRKLNKNHAYYSQGIQYKEYYLLKGQNLRKNLLLT